MHPHSQHVALGFIFEVQGKRTKVPESLVLTVEV